jgi:hypothetical protein
VRDNDGRKQVIFDLDTTASKIYYPSDTWNGAYDFIKRHIESELIFMRSVKPEGNPSFMATLISLPSVLLIILLGVCFVTLPVLMGAPITTSLFGSLVFMLIFLGVLRVIYHFKNSTGK